MIASGERGETQDVLVFAVLKGVQGFDEWISLATRLQLHRLLELRGVGLVNRDVLFDIFFPGRIVFLLMIFIRRGHAGFLKSMTDSNSLVVSLRDAIPRLVFLLISNQTF